MVYVGDLEPRVHGFNVIQVDIGCFQEGFVSMECVIRNQENDILSAKLLAIR